MPRIPGADRHGARAALFLALTLISCGCNQSRESQLSARVAVYESSWVRKDINDVWALMSPRLRQANDNDPAQFEQYMRGVGIWPGRVRVERITMTESGATVRVLATYTDSSGKTVAETREDMRWVLVAGEWFFDNYQTIGADK